MFWNVGLSRCRSFNPNLARFNVSTKAVTDALLKLWAKCKAQVEEILKVNGILAASVTTDSWTSKGNQHFTATTIHFIAEYMVREGLLVKSGAAPARPSSVPEPEVFDPTKATIQVVCLPLDCVSTPGTTKGVDIVKALDKFKARWRFRRIYSAVTDCEPSMVVAIRSMILTTHGGCVDHRYESTTGKVFEGIPAVKELMKKSDPSQGTSSTARKHWRC